MSKLTKPQLALLEEFGSGRRRNASDTFKPLLTLIKLGFLAKTKYGYSITNAGKDYLTEEIVP